MGKTKRKDHSEVQFLRGEVRRLKAELKYYKRRDHLVDDHIDELVDENEIENVNASKCSSCGKGVLIEYDFSFVILKKCDHCGYAEKQKKK